MNGNSWLLILLSTLVAVLIWVTRPRECLIPAREVALYLTADDLATQIWGKCRSLALLNDPREAKCGELFTNTAQVAEKARFSVERELEKCRNGGGGEEMLPLEQKEGRNMRGERLFMSDCPDSEFEGEGLLFWEARKR